MPKISAKESGTMKEVIPVSFGADLASAKSYRLLNDFAPSSLSYLPVLSGALVVGFWFVPLRLMAPTVLLPLF